MSVKSFTFGAALSALVLCGANYAMPTQAVVQYVPASQGFEVKTYRAGREHAYVIPQFVIPEHDGTDEGACPDYSDHWFGLCVPA